MAHWVKQERKAYYTKNHKIMLKIEFLMGDNVIMTNNGFVQKTVKTDFSTIPLDL